MDNENLMTASCMTIIVGKNASSTGHVMLVHNEDDYVHASVHHMYMPAADHAAGETLPAENGNIRIPQIPHTLGYHWMQVRGQVGGLSTADSFFNEAGVAIVSDSSCGSSEDAALGTPCEGGIVYELRRALGERSKSAKDGLRVAIDLVSTYGYASPGRIYSICDKDEAYMIQVVRGNRYLAARLPDDCICVMPNHYTFHTLEDVPEMYYPGDLVSHAAEMGWYDPETEEFDFAKAYQDPKTYRVPTNTLRQRFATEILLGHPYDAEKDGYPFCVKAERKITPELLKQAMSTHYDGTVCDVRTGPGASPHFTNVRRVCTGTTVECDLYLFGDTPLTTTVYTAYGRPCELPFIPMHPLCGTPANLEYGLDPVREAERHLTFYPGSTNYRTDGWQRMRDFENAFDFQYTNLIGKLKEMKAKVESKFIADNTALLASCEGLTEAEMREKIAAFDEQAVEEAMDAIDAFKDDNFHQTTIDEIAFDGVSATVTFPFTRKPDISYLIFGPGRGEPDRDYARCISLEKKDGIWEAKFEFNSVPLEKDGPGIYEFFLGGRTVDGDPFVAMKVTNK